ncbi:MAG: methyltransferase domain-containing protein [Neptuniibacter sp.]
MEITSHYETHLDSKKIISALQQTYPNGADKYQMAPIDQLHIGGIKASEKLLNNLNSSDKVLEIGSGCGGLMRLVSGEGIDVTGLDISHSFNVLNCQLSSISKASRNSANPRIITGDAHYLPLPDNCFSVVVMQHSLLNMPDTLRVLSECKRVLKPSGRLVLHEIFQGKADIPMSFPVPWASNLEESCLVNEAEFEELLNESGFKIERIDNWTTEALKWRKKQETKEKVLDYADFAVSPLMIFGEQFSQMAGNVVQNLEQKTIQVVELVVKLK